jgi:phosphoribosylformylglycinamidine (FGAM) synthase PurS component
MNDFNLQKFLIENKMTRNSRLLNENEENLKKQLHTLVGNEMRLGKKADMSGAAHHTEEHKKAEKALEDFLRMNPSMEEYRDEVEDHFTKQLFK